MKTGYGPGSLNEGSCREVVGHVPSTSACHKQSVCAGLCSGLLKTGYESCLTRIARHKQVAGPVPVILVN